MVKKLFTITVALITALFFSEILIGSMLGFPKYGVEVKMKGLRCSPGHQNIYKPYSKYWNSKGKFEIYKRNNLGLPGIDCDTGVNSKYVCILGSSFIENNYIKPEALSTSVMQNLLKDTDKNYNVLNLGYNGYDPYDSYRRIYYYEKKFKPETVILVINAYNSDSYRLTENPFELNSDLFTIDNTFRTKINLLIRNNLSCARLMLTLVQGANAEQVVEPSVEPPDANKVDLTDLEICLMQFDKKYKEKFICVSIMNNDTINMRIDSFCKLNNIKFEYSNLMIPENQIIGDWHLNENGNSKLGYFLNQIYTKHYLHRK
ncbi:MAG: hypothetical protein HY959_09045 [Ignavibacteriae bacterium]|nr:hypothetical protein [Ignavibacteriota bacterium]